MSNLPKRLLPTTVVDQEPLANRRYIALLALAYVAPILK